jgi:hypothetical protein
MRAGRLSFQAAIKAAGPLMLTVCRLDYFEDASSRLFDLNSDENRVRKKRNSAKIPGRDHQVATSKKSPLGWPRPLVRLVGEGRSQIDL